MQEDPLRTALHGEFGHGMDVFFVAVYTTRRQQPEQVYRLAVFDGQVHGVGQGVIVEEGAGLDGATDTGEFLVNHAAGTQVKVTDLGISHLAGRQADGGSGGTNQGVRVTVP